MDSCNFPRTVEEMLEAGWYDRILKKVKKANLKDVLNSPEELVQDVFLNIIKTDYLAKYDPEYRPFNVYIYVMVNNLIKKRGIREGTKGGKQIVNAVALEDTMDGDVPASNTVYLDLLDLEDDQDQVDDRLYIDSLVEETRKSLQEFKASSTVEYDGKVLTREPSTVFELILNGKSVSEVAEMLKVSKQYIYVLLHKVRSTASMQELHQDAISRNLIESPGTAG